jgi:hypothetical protein
MIGRAAVSCLLLGCSERALPLPEGRDLGVADLQAIPDLEPIRDLRPPPPPDLACVPPGVPTRPWCAQFAEAWSARMSRCRGGAVESWRPKAWLYCAAWEASLRAGRVHFYVPATGACLTSLAEMSCEGLDAFTDDPNHPCRLVWPGGGVGAPCRSGLDCLNGMCWRSPIVCEGSCLTIGWCDSTAPVPCPYPAVCVQENAGPTCAQPIPDYVDVPDRHSAWVCAEGHHSVDVVPGASSMCVPDVPTGGACDGGGCFATDHCAGGFCVRKGAAGEPCSGFDSCEYGTACDNADGGVCVPAPPAPACNACVLE